MVGVETEKVSKEKAIADFEEEKVTKIEIEVTKKQRDCESDLAKAEPALLAAQEALNTLNKVLKILESTMFDSLILNSYIEQSDRIEIFRISSCCCRECSGCCHGIASSWR